MNLIRKKETVQVTPEVKLLEASAHVQAQSVALCDIIAEIRCAQKRREEAQEELQKEITSLESALQRKKDSLALSKANDNADEGFIRELQKLTGM